MEWINEGPEMNDNETEVVSFCRILAACGVSGLLCDNLCIIQFG